MSFFGIGNNTPQRTSHSGGGNFDIGTIAGAVSPAIGGLFNAFSRKQDQRYTQNMARFNQGLQQENARFMNDLNLQFWKDTNAKAQMKELQKAGLNPALMYKQGGPGGQTLGTGMSSAGAGNPNANIMGIGLEFAQLQKQLKLMDAQAEKTSEEAESIKMDNMTKSHFGQEADSLEAQNRINRAKAEGKMLYNEWASSNEGYTWMGKTKAENRAEEMIQNQYLQSEIEGRIAQEQDKYVANKVKYEYFNTMFEAELKEARIDLTREQERKIWHDIWQGWVNAGLKGLDTIIKGRFKDIIPKKK